tara:strand:+ start:187 stop:408 length:222 start_codon:yes stop_codon:yes gene_type:complete
MYKDPLEDIYKDLFEHSMHLLEEHNLPVEAVAGSLMAISLRLYRSSLSEENFNKMKNVIMESEVAPYKRRKLH